MCVLSTLKTRCHRDVRLCECKPGVRERDRDTERKTDGETDRKIERGKGRTCQNVFMDERCQASLRVCVCVRVCACVRVAP